MQVRGGRFIPAGRVPASAGIAMGRDRGGRLRAHGLRAPT
jgi:hypothetical protein